MDTHMIGAVSIIEHHVASGLMGARLIGLMFVVREVEREGYWEDRYIIAWENEDQCGTHWANVNSNEEVMTTIGHYFRGGFSQDRRRDALISMIERAGR